MTDNNRRIGCVDGEALVAYLRGEGDAAERERVREHLAACKACADEAQAYEAVVAKLESAPEEAPVRDLSSDVLRRIGARDVADRNVCPTVAWRMRAAMLAAAALLIVAGGWIGARMLVESGRTSPPATAGPETLALRWLAESQEPDGSWNPAKWGGEESYRTGITALALLALTGDGHDGEPATSAAADRATAYLLAHQNKVGAYGPFFSAMLYNHGIATVALLERYRSSPDAPLKASIGRAIAFIESEQQKGGGWGYLKSAANTSLSAWQVQALLLGAGADWPDARPAAERALAWFEGNRDSEGRVGYCAPGDFPYGPNGLTAMAALCLAMDRRDDPSLDRRMADAAASGLSESDYVQVYFLAHALSIASQRGGATDERLAGLSARLTRAVAERQLHAGPNSGSWDPSDRWGRAGGRVYSTAMGVLSLRAEDRARRLTSD